MAHRLSTSSISARKRLKLALLASFYTLSLLLTGCGAEDASVDRAPADAAPDAKETVDPPEQSVPSGSAGVATARIDGTDYTFDLAFCAIGEDDTLVHGPGTSASGEDAYLDIDFLRSEGMWAGELRIDLGISTQFDSSDQFFLFTTYRDDGDKLLTNIAVMKMFSATGTYWVDGEQVGVDGNVEVDCG